MTIFDFIEWNNAAPGCGRCIHFKNDPAFIEQAYSGLTVLSSGFASVRDRDGICTLHQLYLSAKDHCAQFNTADLDKLKARKPFSGNPAD